MHIMAEKVVQGLITGVNVVAMVNEPLEIHIATFHIDHDPLRRIGSYQKNGVSC